MRLMWEIFTVLIMLSVGFASFGLGRLSASGMTPQPVQIVHPPATQAAAVATTAGNLSKTVDEQLLPIIPESGKFVASKNGTKYHFPWCSGAKRISEKNKVWFSSADHARRAGYEPAANCRGLE